MSSGFGVPKMDFSALERIGLNLARNDELERRRGLASQLGASLKNDDYAGAASLAFDAGEPDTGLQLMKLGETRRQTLLGEKASADFLNSPIFGGSGGSGLDGGGPPALGPRSGASRAVPSFADQGAPSSGYVASLFRRESGNDPNAKATTSSAQGLGQFTTGTWAGVAKQHPELGLTPDGRTDPDQMLRATNAFTADNEKLLAQSGLPVNDASRYSMHFLGAGGGRRFVAGTMANPDRPVTDLVSPQAAQANRSIFYGRDGRPKTAGEVFSSFERSFGGGGAPAPRQTAGLDPRADMPMPGATPLVGQMPGLDDAATIPPGISESGRLRPALPSSDPNARNVPGAGFGGPDTAAALDVPTLGGPAPDRVMRMPGDASPVQVAENMGGRPMTAEDAQMRQIQGIGSGNLGAGQKIQALSRAVANPYLPDGPRQLANTMLKSALDDAKLPEGVKEFMWARANGLTQAKSPSEYAREGRGPTTLAPGTSVLSPDGKSIALTAPDRERDNRVSADIEAREAGAARLGLRPGSPAYQGYVLTGKMPREDAQPLSASDKKAILEADDGVMSAETAIQNLQQAKQVSKKAYEGPTASARGSITGYFGSEAGLATTDLDNLVTSGALGQLKSIFGAAPTEGERKILLDIQGSSSLPDAARQKIYDRGIALAQRRLQMNRERASELRDQTYYKSDSGPPGSREGVPRTSTNPRALPPPSTANRPDAASPGDRFNALIGSGMSKEQAYQRLQAEGY